MNVLQSCFDVASGSILASDGGFHTWRYPKTDGFLMEHPIKDFTVDDWAVPLFQETSIYIVLYDKVSVGNSWQLLSSSFDADDETSIYFIA